MQAHIHELVQAKAFAFNDNGSLAAVGFVNLDTHVLSTHLAFLLRYNGQITEQGALEVELFAYWDQNLRLLAMPSVPTLNFELQLMAAYVVWVMLAFRRRVHILYQSHTMHLLSNNLLRCLLSIKIALMHFASSNLH